jgi:hypothetical protein
VAGNGRNSAAAGGKQDSPVKMHGAAGRVQAASRLLLIRHFIISTLGTKRPKKPTVVTGASVRIFARTSAAVAHQTQTRKALRLRPPPSPARERDDWSCLLIGDPLYLYYIDYIVS